MSSKRASSKQEKDQSKDDKWEPYFADSKRVNIKEDFEIKEQLGDGGFSVVKRGVRNGQQFAIKMIKKRKVPKEDLTREVEIWTLASANSDRVVHLYEIYEDSRHVNLVMELMTGGELFSKIVEMEDYSEAYAATIMKQVFYIIKDLHKVHIVHQDLKPENLLLVGEDNGQDTSPSAGNDASKKKHEPMAIKLCDFGLAEIAGDEIELVGIVGSTTYMAPEVVAETGHSKPVDIYAAGVIMYILLCGFPPFEPENNITELEFPNPEWEEISPQAKHLISRLLSTDPEKRPVAEQALKDVWFQDVQTMKAPKPLYGTIKTLRKYNHSNNNTGDKAGYSSDNEGNSTKRGTVFGLFDSPSTNPVTTITTTPPTASTTTTTSSPPLSVSSTTVSVSELLNSKSTSVSTVTNNGNGNINGSNKLSINAASSFETTNNNIGTGTGVDGNSVSKTNVSKESNARSASNKKSKGGKKNNKKKQHRNSVAYDKNVAVQLLAEIKDEEKKRTIAPILNQPPRLPKEEKKNRGSITLGTLQPNEFFDSVKNSTTLASSTTTTNTTTTTTTTVTTNSDDYSTLLNLEDDTLILFQKEISQQTQLIGQLKQSLQSLSTLLQQEKGSRENLETAFKNEISNLSSQIEIQKKENQKIQLILSELGQSYPDKEKS